MDTEAVMNDLLRIFVEECQLARCMKQVGDKLWACERSCYLSDDRNTQHLALNGLSCLSGGIHAHQFASQPEFITSQRLQIALLQTQNPYDEATVSLLANELQDKVFRGLDEP